MYNIDTYIRTRNNVSLQTKKEDWEDTRPTVSCVWSDRDIEAWPLLLSVQYSQGNSCLGRDPQSPVLRCDWIFSTRYALSHSIAIH